MSVHPSVLRGFGSAAEVYERARPTYPDDAVAWLAERLGIGPGRTVVDLAAGTGKLTRLLVPSGARVIAIEPVDEMRAQLEAAVPGAEAVGGYAERMPLADGSADAVTAAQAFHWFANDEALGEIVRVLVPGGRLGLIWNVRDERDPITHRLAELIEPLRGDESTHVGAGWRAAVEASPLFGPIEEAHFRLEQRLDADGLAERVASTSFVASAPAEARERLLEEVRALAGDGMVTVPYDTAVFATQSLRR
jgi:SAM-dependent methyltransferase